MPSSGNMSRLPPGIILKVANWTVEEAGESLCLSPSPLSDPACPSFTDVVPEKEGEGTDMIGETPRVNSAPQVYCFRLDSPGEM